MRRVFRSLVVATPLMVGLAAPAEAQQSYPPETLSLALVTCDLEDLIVTVDGAQPNSTLHLVIDYTNAPDVTADVPADALGHFSGSYPIPPNASALIVVTISGLDYDPQTPGGIPFNRSFDVDRRTCPNLPETGSDAAPVGKIALGATLAGALLIVVAVRRRRRDDEPLAA